MGEVADVVGGGTPRTDDPRNYADGEIPWITPADLSGYREKLISRGARNITKKGLEGSGAKMMPARAVLFSSRAPIGYVAIAANPVSTNQGFKSFVLPQGLSPDYVYYYLKAARDLAVSLASGTTFLEISGAKAAQIPVAIAPIREQRRIVAGIEEQFTRLEAGVEALRRVQASLKRYRASVLKAACEGRLVPTEAELARAEGREYEPADKLLARILEERRARWEAVQLAKMHAAGKAPKDDKWKAKYKEPVAPDSTNLPNLPEGWVWARWEQVGFSQNGRSFPSKEYQASGVKLLRPGNLHIRGLVEWTEENTRFLPKRWEAEFPGFIVGARELVMNLTAQSLKDEFLGRVCITRNSDDCLLNQRIARLTPVHVLPEYLLWMFKSEVFRQFVDGLNKGSLIQHMFTSQLAAFCLPLPPLAEQHRIVAEVEQRLSVIDELETVVEANLKRAERLRQAILKRAFEGKLVPQDPSDEPASVLLERIKAAKSSSSTATPGCGTQPTTGKSACVTGSTATPGCGTQPTTGKSACVTGSTATPGCGGVKKLKSKKARAGVPGSPARG
jgi:type I restriction enzyme S subunit